MLKICQTPLPQSLLSYVAFRVAFRETLDRLTSRQRHLTDNPGGFLAEIPFLKEVPTQVQLEILATTWHRHVSRDSFAATLVDESVIYAACEAAARLVESDCEAFVKQLRGGPVDLTVPVDTHLARELRLLYLELPSEADFLLVSQFLDLDPEESAEQKIETGVDAKRLNELFELLGRWHVAPQFTSKLTGLLTEAELSSVNAALRVHCRNITHQH